jgi:hypothetical protein
MPSTKMFRDRVVSLEQTFEAGEKHLPLLQGLVREAIPELEFREYQLDHENDCFVMIYATPEGGEKRISWTRMVLYDAERIPAIVEDAQAEIRGRVVEFLRTHAGRPVIAVTFRHLEEGWVDTPEPRKSRGRGRRRRGAGRREAAGRPAAPSGRPQKPRPEKPRPPQAARPAPAVVPPERSPRPSGGEPTDSERPAGAGRRRFRRRRRRRGGGGPPASGGGSPAQ